jgi:hypothetical protein
MLIYLLRCSFRIADIHPIVIRTTEEDGTMAILDDLNDDIRLKVGDLQAGQQFSLRTLFGGREEFEKYGSSGQRKALGTQFRKAVAAGEFEEVEYSHHHQSPAEHWYRRV